MKIITKNSDFYDSVLGYGVDNTIIYKREMLDYDMIDNGRRGRTVFSPLGRLSEDKNYALLPKSIKELVNVIRENAIGRDYDISDGSKELRVSESYILFCGELIPVMIVSGNTSAHPNDVVRKKGEFSYERFKEGFYSLDGLIEFLNSAFDESFIDGYMKGSSRFSVVSRLKIFDEFFKINSRIDFSHVHHELEVPLVMIGPVKYIKNPVLKDIKFARKYDPFTTYQKIEQFISGVMGGRSPKMVEIADIDRLVGHGFDKKTSFRKAKEK